MSLRDPEFRECLEGFYATSVLEKEPRLPHHQVSAIRSSKMTYILTTCCVEDASRYHAVSLVLLDLKHIIELAWLALVPPQEA